MKNLLIAVRSLFKKGRHNGMKILSLGIGLAVGLVLIAKVYFEQSYDVFFPDYDRIYQIQSVLDRDNELKAWPQVSGAIAPGMQAEVPEVEVATRFTGIAYDEVLMTPDRKKYKADVILADTNLFKVFPLPVISGNPEELLARPMYVMVSEEIARRMGGDVVGKTFWMDSYPGKVLTVGGVFGDVPENSHLNFDVILSMSSIGRFTWDGTNNWLGNDRYKGYVKLLPGVTPESIAPAIRQMQERHQDLEEIKKMGMDILYALRPLEEVHNKTEGVKRTVLMLSLLAFALLFTAVMNYVLIVISNMVSRTKEVAVHKCYGASEKNIHGMVFSEAFLHLLLALLLAVGLVLLFRGTVQELVQASVGALFLSKGSLVLLGVCVVILLVTGLVPGYLYARVPVASAFRNFRENRRLWKLGLLFFQFIASGFLVTLLLVIGKQYNRMVDDDPGYVYDRLAYASLAGVDSTLRQKVVDEMLRLPEVKEVSACTQLFFQYPSGNNVFLPDDDRELFNIADQYWVWNGFLDLMEVPVVQGRSFLENVPSSDEVMVSRSFVKKMALTAGWDEDVIGRSIRVTEHSQTPGQAFTICGVYEDVRLGSIVSQDMRPSVMFYHHQPTQYLLVKFHTFTPEARMKMEETLQTLMPDKDVTVYSWQSEMVGLYRESRQFRDAVMIGGIITLLISLIGLIGYMNDEINRRRSEVAVRKVNGATFKDIAGIFLVDILRIALPALVLGAGFAYYAATKWQEQFTEKVALSWYIFVGAGLFVLAVITGVALFNIRRAANENPVNCLKSE